jgi:hypothetical protein
MRKPSFLSLSTLTVCLTLGGCFGGGEPSESEMKLAFVRFIQTDRTISESKMNEFKKHACKESPSKPGYVCDFFVDASLKGNMFLPNIHANLSGRFFSGQNNELQFVIEQG